MSIKEYKNYIINLYDIYIYRTEKRGISYGEINHIQNLKLKELEKLENEIMAVLDNEI